jgi:putative cell wall-binding protein
MQFRRGLQAVIVALALGPPIVPMGSDAVGATVEALGVSRLSGSDRYETAAAISRSAFPTPTAVFLASGENYPDALAGGPAAASLESPVLLTRPGVIPSATAQEIDRVAPDKIFVLGGTGAVSDSVASQARAHGGEIVRLAGNDRYGTAVAISKHFWRTSNVVYLATGSGYADALSGGALAAKSGAPVLLSDTKSLPSSVADELRRLAPSKVVLLGGTSVLTGSVEAAVHAAVPTASVSRLGGADRYATSAAVAAAGWSTSTRAFYDNGTDFSDALAGVPAIAENDAPLLLTTRSCMPASIATATTNLHPTVEVLLGGPEVLSNESATRLCTATPPPPPTSPPPTSPPPTSTTTFGDLMHPESTTVLTASDATVTFTDQQPSWFAHNQEIRWDTPGAFTHSLDPVPYDTLFMAETGLDYRDPTIGAEYHVNNSTYKNADVRFTVTGNRFAIRYWTLRQSDAMIWIDGHPASSHAFAGTDTTGSGSWNWLVVTRTSDAPVTVRFAGPLFFTGVDHDAGDAVTVTAAPRFTLGVISDSQFEAAPDTHPMTQTAGPMLSTLTGFRIWNMAESGTGYVDDGSGAAATGGVGFPGNLSSPFGSARRIASITSAPIDALLVNGSINDLYWSADKQRAEMDAFLDKVAQARPGLPVVLVSIEPLSSSTVHDQTNPGFQALDANFAVVAARHPNVVGVIDPYTADWLTGTGSTTHPAGDGNQDQYVGADGIHLNAPGQAYYQGRIVQALRQLPARLTP